MFSRLIANHSEIIHYIEDAILLVVLILQGVFLYIGMNNETQ